MGELSGGQRSLVALSFILAMLLFKPAPIYILDEVDAALDLSHTQNIGQMLKAHFTHSQVNAFRNNLKWFDKGRVKSQNTVDIIGLRVLRFCKY